MTNEILDELRELRRLLASHTLQDTENFGKMDEKLDTLTVSVARLSVRMSVVWGLGGGALALAGSAILGALVG